MANAEKLQQRLKSLKESFAKAKVVSGARLTKLCNAAKSPFKKLSAQQAKIKTACRAAFEKAKGKLSGKTLTEKQQAVRKKTLSVLATIFGIAGSVYLTSLWSDNPKTVTTMLEEQNFTEIKITGYRVEPTRCNMFEPFRAGFTAHDSTQTAVTGTVCKNIFSQRRITVDNPT